MRVEGNRIGARKSRKQVLSPRVQNSGRPISAIDMEPEIEFPGDVRHLFEWIDDARRNCSGAPYNTAWSEPVAQILFDQFPQTTGVEAQFSIALNCAYIIASQTKNVSRLGNRHVNFGGGVDSHWRSRVP